MEKKVNWNHPVELCAAPARMRVGIYTDRDQRSIVLGFQFRKSVFLGVLVKAAVFF